MALPHATIISAGIYSVSGDLNILNTSVAISTSKELVSGANGSALSFSVCLTSFTTSALTANKTSRSTYLQYCDNLQADPFLFGLAYYLLKPAL
jgi:hypothetical protein